MTRGGCTCRRRYSSASGTRRLPHTLLTLNTRPAPPALHTHASYLTNRSQCAFRMRNYEAALRDAQAAVQLDAAFGKGHLRVAGCNIVFGDFEAARKNLALARQCADDRSRREVEAELARLEQVCKQEGELSKSWDRQDWRAVLYYSSQLMDAAPKKLSFVVSKAEALVYSKKVEEALNLMADVLRLDDKNVDALFVRGLSVLSCLVPAPCPDLSSPTAPVQDSASSTRKTSTRPLLTSSAPCSSPLTTSSARLSGTRSKTSNPRRKQQVSC